MKKGKSEDKYLFRIAWSVEDAEPVGLCAEFPSLTWLAPTPGAAIEEIREQMAETVDEMARR